MSITNLKNEYCEKILKYKKNKKIASECINNIVCETLLKLKNIDEDIIYKELKFRLDDELYSYSQTETDLKSSTKLLLPFEIDKKKWNKHILRNQYKFDINNQMITSDQYTCLRCKTSKTEYYELQTRSADEPMTLFLTCVNCKNKWTQ
jgi:DNA-directed RNA polymerase subunit M/transcription elongation factor TFIIS